MKVEILADIFAQGPSRPLSVIINLCAYKNRYDLSADLAKISGLPGYEALSLMDKEIFVASFNAEIVGQENTSGDPLSGGKIKISNMPDSQYYTIEEAHLILNQQVSLLLENSLNDSYFLEALVKAFEPGSLLDMALNNNWVDFDNAGGCKNYENHITRKLRSFEGQPRPSHAYFRCFVLLDSDREFPEEDINLNHLKLEKFLIDNNIKYHILEKRNMENYMPDKVFEEFDGTGGNHPWIKAHSHLKPRQKDFLNISKGFLKRDGKGGRTQVRTDLSTGIQALYSDLSDSSFNILDNTMEIPGFKGNFPKKFKDSHHVYRQSLLSRTAHQDDPEELLAILNKINSLL